MFTLQITHKIDADIDVERDFIITSLTEAQGETTIEPLVNFTTGYHSRNGGGDTVHTDGTLPVVDVSAAVPAPGCDPLTSSSDPSSDLPFQILLSAILTMVVGPLAILGAIVDDGSRSTPERQLLGVIAAVAVASFVCAILTLRGSAWARRWWLLLTSLIVIADVVTYEASGDAGIQLSAVYHAGVMILVVLALSSPAATAWCNRGRH